MKIKLSLTLLVLIIIACKNKANQQSVENDGTKHSTFVASDTIPSITIKEKHLAYPQIFEGSFLKQTVVRQQGLDIKFKIKEVGDIIVSTGKIIATDPMVLYEAIPFTYHFPIGHFPVELAIAKIDDDERVAFVRIVFSKNKIAKWEFALLPDQKQIDLKSKLAYGYGVDAGLGLFLDESVAKKFSELVSNNWDKIYIDEFDKNYVPSWGYLNYPIGDQNAVSFSTGFGDGFYSTFIGRDKNGNICQLLTDFDMIYWQNLSN